MKKTSITRTATVAFVTNVVPAYRYPVFDRLARSEGFRLKILVTVPLSESCREAVATLPIKYSISLNLKSATRHKTSGTIQTEALPIPLGLVKDLFKIRPDVIVAGDWGLRSLVCWGVAKCLGARLALWSEEIASSAQGRSRLQIFLRGFLSLRADAFLAWGDPARLYLRALNVPESRIFLCAQAIDNEFWLRRSSSLDKKAERSELGLSGFVFLLVGRTVQLKGFQNFLQAFSRLPADLHSRISAIIVGDGDYLETLKSLAVKLNLENVRFVGAKAPEELAKFYAAADAFVLPSLVDVWGLVVNEAMCFGLPVLASKFAGASQAIAASSEYGAVFDPTHIDEFATLLRRWAEVPTPFSRSSIQHALQEMTFDKSIEAIQSMILAASPIGKHRAR